MKAKEVKEIKEIYNILLINYGPQGWWPLSDIGYHPNKYYVIKTHKQIFEVYVGAILTQANAWTNVEKSIFNLKKNNLLNPKAIIESDARTVKHAIKNLSYYNQKYERLVEVSKFYLSLKDRMPTRHELLSVKGIGKETADSILLYAHREPIFVVDTYTKRILLNLKLIKKNTKYEEIQKLFMDNLPKDFKVYQEYHALLVEHGKRHYTKKAKKGKTLKVRDPLLIF